MDLRIELVFDQDCPNVGGWRVILCAALRELGLPTRWQEWDRVDPKAPAYAANMGSPSVLIDGRDLFPAPATAGASCRLYPGQHGGAVGVPAHEMVVDALRAALGLSAPARRADERGSAEGSNRPRRRGLLGAFGASSTAGISSLVSAVVTTCCVGPITGVAVVTALGASGAVWLARLGPYRPYIMAGAAVLLIYGFWSVYRPRKACPVHGRALWLQRLTKGMLWISAVLWVGALALEIFFA